MQPLALSESEIDDAVAFLVSLTGPQYKAMGDQEYGRQLAISKMSRDASTARRASPGVLLIGPPGGPRGAVPHSRLLSMNL
jgi:cytochrome c peroxidase